MFVPSLSWQTFGF
jgi:hypothetical protein